MSLTVRLVPKLGDPHEILQDGVSERCQIMFDSNNISNSNSDEDNELVVGRGPLTGIADQFVETAAFRLSFDRTCLQNHQVRASLLVYGRESNLYINGLPWDEDQPHLYLSHGDNISLDGLRYEYKVHIEAREQTASSTSPWPVRGKVEATLGSVRKRKAQSLSEDVISVLSSSPEPEDSTGSPTPNAKKIAVAALPTIAISPESASRITDEIQCSVCLDIQVHSRTANPCGHSFCGSCLEQLQKQCPQCRKPIESHVPAVQLDSLIAALVTIPDLLDNDDVDHYHERQSNTRKENAIDSTSARKPPRRRAPRTARSTAFIPRHYDPAMAPPFRQNSSTNSAVRWDGLDELPAAAATAAAIVQSPPSLMPVAASRSSSPFHHRRHPRTGAGSTQQDAICID